MPHRTWVSIEVNGQQHRLEIDHRTTLLEVLRDHLDLTGAKRACDRGECGACTVLLDQAPVYACQLLALQARGRAVTTIEGLAAQPAFGPVLEAFVAHDAGQCGFCTPGFAVATYAALQRYPTATETELRWELVGHLCRCNAYDKIMAAVREVSRRQQGAA